MKLRKLIPITGLGITIAGLSPIALSSCSSFRFINVINGYTPSSKPRDEHQFSNYAEVCQYYLGLNKDTLAQDYIWSLGEYVKENMEFPTPILPFKFTKITQANISVEQWFTQKYKDENVKDAFLTSFTSLIQIAGSTEPRVQANSYGSYVPYSNVYFSLQIELWKVPYTIKNKHLSSNKTDAVWIVQPASDDLLKSFSEWNISSSITITYSKKNSLDETVSTTDYLGCYWNTQHIYDPVLDPQKSYLFPVIYDALIYGSYHLQNCTISPQ